MREIRVAAGVGDAHEALAACAEGAAGDADDALLVKQTVAEILTAHAESTDVGKDIECARGVVAVHAGNGGQTFQQRRAAAREDVAQLRAQLRMVKCGNRGVLTDGICAGVEVFLTFGHAVDDLRGAC